MLFISNQIDCSTFIRSANSWLLNYDFKNLEVSYFFYVLEVSIYAKVQYIMKQVCRFLICLKTGIHGVGDIC